MSPYQITIDEQAYDLSAADLQQVDIVSSNDGTYHLLRGGKSYRCSVETFDPHNKRLIVNINGRSVTVTVADRYDLIVKELGFATQAAVSTKDIIAPMPGLVLKIMAGEGDEVKSGTPLMILEAMKMENVLKSAGEGRIKAIHVTQGEAVDKRQLLIELE